MDPKIIYEDEYILALDKPSGLIVHADGRSKESPAFEASADRRKTLVDWINENYPELGEVGELQVLQNGELIKRPGIVHRLDRETSGVIIVAKTKEAFEFLKKQFQDRKIEKIYNAVVMGNFSTDKMEGVINKSIGRSASDFRKWSAEHGAKGKLREALTEYKVLRGGKGFSYLEVRPKTGRTHQIRVHLKSIGHPVVGDRLYGPKGMNHELGITNYGEELKTERLMLHAVSVKLELPNHTVIKIESPLPEEFENVKKS
jgi:23S rRNA pseudouridine1911/1915/1917 synthase